MIFSSCRLRLSESLKNLPAAPAFLPPVPEVLHLKEAISGKPINGEESNLEIQQAAAQKFSRRYSLPNEYHF